ncbi:MAG: hypothetical protein ACOCVL_01080 [Candidatus Sumerlaeota bacterium]
MCLLILVLGGCTFVHSPKRPMIQPLLPVDFPQRPPDYPVTVTAGDFDQPYTRVAIVTTRVYDEALLDSVAIGELKQLARRVGADAVLGVKRNMQTVEQYGYQPNAFFRYSTRYVDRTALGGVAVRFVREGESR